MLELHYPTVTKTILERQYPGKPTLKVAFGNDNGAIFENSSKLRASLFVTSRWPRSSGQTNYQVHHPPLSPRQWKFVYVRPLTVACDISHVSVNVCGLIVIQLTSPKSYDFAVFLHQLFHVWKCTLSLHIKQVYSVFRSYDRWQFDSYNVTLLNTVLGRVMHDQRVRFNFLRRLQLLRPI